eukprot:2216689-Lingulodinium_polyedra.AAC.1
MGTTRLCSRTSWPSSWMPEVRLAWAERSFALTLGRPENGLRPGGRKYWKTHLHVAGKELS